LSQFVVNFFEIFWSCVVLQELCGYIICVSIRCQMKKLWSNKQEMDIGRQSPKNHKMPKWIFLNFFLKYYVLSIFKALIHSIWTRDEKVMDNFSFLGNLIIFKKTFCPTLNANIFLSIKSNLMKFLLHDFRKVKCKILWQFRVDFDRKHPWGLRG